MFLFFVYNKSYKVMERIYLFCMMLLILSCNGKQSGKDGLILSLSPVTKNDSLFLVNIDTAQEQDFLKISELFSHVRYIPLETNAASLIGRITQLCTHGDTIFILDAVVTKKVQAFYKDGRHISTVGSRGKGPGEYRSPSSMGIDGDFLYLYDAGTRRLLFYDVRTLRFDHSVKFNLSTANRYVAMLEGEIYTDAYDWNTVNPFLIQNVDRETGQSAHQWLSTEDYNLGFLDATYFTGEVSFYKTEKAIRYHQVFSDTIMEITQEGVSPYLCLQSKRWVSREDLSELQKKKGDSFRSIRTGINGIYNIHYYVEWGNHLSFSFNQRNYIKHVILNKEDRTFILVKNLYDDLVFTQWENSINVIPIWGDAGGLYGYIHSLEMENFLSLLRGGMVNVTDRDKAVLSDLPDDANPILMYYE